MNEFEKSINLMLIRGKRIVKFYQAHESRLDPRAAKGCKPLHEVQPAMNAQR